MNCKMVGCQHVHFQSWWIWGNDNNKVRFVHSANWDLCKEGVIAGRHCGVASHKFNNNLQLLVKV